MIRPTVFPALLVAASIVGLVAAGPTQAVPGGRPFVSGEVILKFKGNATASEIEQVYAGLGGARLKGLGRAGVELRRLEGLGVEEAVSRFGNHPAVEYVEPNYIVDALGVPNDPLFPQLHGLHNTGQLGGTPGADIRAVSAWDVFTGSSSVLVAVIDTGVDYLHPDLAANIWTNPGEIPGNGVDDDGNGFVDDGHGYDVYNDDGDPMDDNGHGTHAAGMIGAVGDNGLGVVGVNWTIRIMALKFLNASGTGTTAGAIEAINYATMMGARLTNNSWGGGGFSQALLDAINAADAAGVLFVAAAGASSSDNDLYPSYPSSYPSANIVAVAATDASDNLAGFSNYGATSVDLAAPGVDILSTTPGNSYRFYSGTSMATAHVSGALGLVMGRYPAMGHLEAKERVLGSVDVKPGLAGRCLSGGRLNAFLAIAEPDTQAPGAITDLAAASAGSNRILLTWTAPGDDGGTGTASSYVVKLATVPIDESDFESATSAANPPDPGPAGSPESMTVEGLQFGTPYHFAVKARDEFGNAGAISNPAAATTQGAPRIEVMPAALVGAAPPGGSKTKPLTVCNQGESDLDFSVTWRRDAAEPCAVQAESWLDVEKGTLDSGSDPADPRPGMLGAGGPDMYGYTWKDSDDPAGPAFEWIDISAVGTLLSISGDDQRSPAVPIGFSFPFYGGAFDQVSICTNGWLSFTNTTLTSYSNQPLPNAAAAVPENLLAVFWDDLHFRGVPRASVHGDGSRFVVQYSHVSRLSTTADLTFQVVLYPNGSIVYQYLAMIGEVASATIGIQNGTKTDGLSVVFNAPYVHDGLAILFRSTPQWLSVSPMGGSLAPGECVDLQVGMNAAELAAGDYTGTITLASNDPATPLLNLDVLFHVGVIDAAATDVEPNTLNLGSQGDWITAYVELPLDLDPAEVVLETVTLNGVVPAATERCQLGDWNHNGIPDWMFKFDRGSLEGALPDGDTVPVAVGGEIRDTIWFLGTDQIRVIRPQLRYPNGGEILVAGSLQGIQWDNPRGWRVEGATILYSADGGDTWLLVAENVPGSSYEWRVPEATTENGKLRVLVHDEAGVMGWDTSDGPFTVTAATAAVEESLPAAPRLHPNVPNPFRAATRVGFDLPEDARVRLEVFDLSGRLVRTLASGPFRAGRHQLTWDGRDQIGMEVPSGVYFCRLRAGAFESVLRMVLVSR